MFKSRGKTFKHTLPQTKQKINNKSRTSGDNQRGIPILLAQGNGLERLHHSNSASLQL